MSKNGMANYQKSSNYVNLTHLPTPKQERQVIFDKLTGGLNLYAPDYQLKRNESPDMENMLWKNGALCSRYGQTYVSETPLLEYNETDTIEIESGVKQYTVPSIITEGTDRLVRIDSVKVDNVAVYNWAYLGGGELMFFTAPSGTEIEVKSVFADKGVQGHTCTSEPYWGNIFFHIGECIYRSEPGHPMTMTLVCDLQTYYHGSEQSKDVTQRGTFLRYGDDLYYKTRGVFLRIRYSSGSFSLSDVYSNAYTPITLINTDWSSGAGDEYQPANFLSNKREVWYNAGTDEAVQTFSGDGSTVDFPWTEADFVYVTDVRVNHATVGNWNTSVSGTTVTITFYTAPVSGTDNIEVVYQKAVKTYYLPETAHSVDKVVVDGTTLSTGYTFTADTNYITFDSAPPVRLPFDNNTVQITYSIAANNAYKTIMDCVYAIVYGGNQNICMVMGGSRFNPNAFFWNGNNVAMDPSYWPVQHYNFGGDTEEPITGFGRQQGHLVVFKTTSVGKVNMNFTTVDVGDSDTTSRVYIEMDYTSINSRIGCDLPWSIQLIDNNLVFCNTQQGVHYLADSSSAYENNIYCISTKVNGDTGRPGLLERVRRAGKVCSFDDEKRYWLIADDRVFCWDYELTNQKDPSWFYLTNIDAVALFKIEDTIYHLGLNGRVTVFDASYSDYGGDLIRRYRFATEYFYSYDRLKTVTSAVFSFRTDTNIEATLEYITDYDQRDDKTAIICHTWSLVPRDLSYRDLSVDSPFAYVARRKPGCRHVRHFTMILTSTKKGVDMPILSTQLFYKYEGRDRGYGYLGDRRA